MLSFPSVLTFREKIKTNFNGHFAQIASLLSSINTLHRAGVLFGSCLPPARFLISSARDPFHRGGRNKEYLLVRAFHFTLCAPVRAARMISSFVRNGEVT